MTEAPTLGWRFTRRRSGLRNLACDRDRYGPRKKKAVERSVASRYIGKKRNERKVVRRYRKTAGERESRGARERVRESESGGSGHAVAVQWLFVASAALFPGRGGERGGGGGAAHWDGPTATAELLRPETTSSAQPTGRGGEVGVGPFAGRGWWEGCPPSSPMDRVACTHRAAALPTCARLWSSLVDPVSSMVEGGRRIPFQAERLFGLAPAWSLSGSPEHDARMAGALATVRCESGAALAAATPVIMHHLLQAAARSRRFSVQLSTSVTRFLRAWTPSEVSSRLANYLMPPGHYKGSYARASLVTSYFDVACVKGKVKRGQLHLSNHGAPPPDNAHMRATADLPSLHCDQAIRPYAACYFFFFFFPPSSCGQPQLRNRPNPWVPPHRFLAGSCDT